MKKFIASLGLACLLINLPVYGSQEAQAGMPTQCTKNNTVRLTKKYRSSKFSGILTAPGSGNQKYKITCIDVADFTRGGKLILKIRLGDGVSSGSFDLFPNNFPIPTQGRPEGTLAGRYDISPNRAAQMIHYFNSDKVFQFGATGNWSSPINSTNLYEVDVTVDRI